MREYQVLLFGKHFGLFQAESATNAITRAKLSSPTFRYEPYSHFKAVELPDGPDEQIWLPDGTSYTTDPKVAA